MAQLGKPQLQRETRISRLHLSNFKAFKDKQNIELLPLTIVAGVNSSGKSALLQSLLLAQDTLSSNKLSEQPLLYSSDRLKFTRFHELIFGKPNRYVKGIGLGFSMPSKIGNDKARKYFGIQPSTKASSFFELGIDAQFDYNEGDKTVFVNRVSLTISEWGQKVAPIVTLLFKPTEQKNKWIIQVTTTSDQLCAQTPFYPWENTEYVTLERFIPLWSARRPSEGSPESRSEIYELYKLFSDFFDRLRTALTSHLHYVGPLRSAPQNVYVHQQLSGLQVSSAGEQTIQLLYENLNTKVDFVKWSGKDFSLSALSRSKEPLKDTLGRAFTLLGIEQDLRIKHPGSSSYEADLNLHHQTRTRVLISQVGFGISQILPIIAVGLLSTPGDFLIFEQPEIHLHPRAQAGLADFLLCLTLTGRQILIETHSDHLINRIRRRLAEDKENLLSERVNLFFVSPPTSVELGANITTAKFDKYGNIEEWPRGFLAETAYESGAIMDAAMDKMIAQENHVDPKEKK
ncbi:MAG TPA: AAA family ATPase [Thermoflexia bacterium]|nr:AAA family ATPase [Thermoflexia bacterium]